MKVSHIGQICFCEKCGNEVIVTKIGSGELLCCKQPMKLIKETDMEIIEEEDEESEE